MKTKEEILKMSKKELRAYKWSEDLNRGEDCTDCSRCSDCIDCHSCYACRNASGLKYAICNVEVGKESFEKKIEELECD
ncbi:hypothetical protein [Candidatus Oleimmundimicrobium sp.]|uniref:hypothetical protein n=1 Tax=Candidatus Oleimmundimicrobium sp. TaxID=3060597 RepID=UPI002727D7C6|nr:hypothetical protein [Candidatus Oleimmundimicrobium sp.]MDO8885736.1 hypothetical protein [Candidatus Oleimmundimicrobium sp.]